MKSQTPFLIYSASAGSGKTYTLVKEYLKILFQSNRLDTYKNILAITFTNKAAGEMKDRILDTLSEFSNFKPLEEQPSMMGDIAKELEISPSQLQKKSQDLLREITYNYASFNVSTIDGFTHKLIRTFAHDLRLPMDFEVEMDVDRLLNEAVDALISKAGSDPDLTKVLIDFALEKADDDKSWDVAFDFYKISKLLVNESDLKFIDQLRNKTFEDFSRLKELLKHTAQEKEEQASLLAGKTLDLIASSGLEFNSFTRSSVPNYFKKVLEKDFSTAYGTTKWQNDLMDDGDLYNKSTPEQVKSTIDGIQSQLAEAFLGTKKLIYEYKFYLAFYKNVTPLSVLNSISKELNVLKSDQNKLLISEFNALISEEIKDQPTPFIYERLGEKYDHYFVDEFQDTSKMQWENLRPLLSNPLDSLRGSVMLVGDAKQAIYRWRGGEAKQFINLASNDVISPFNIEKTITNLPNNFRSFKTIIDFNNQFFSYLSGQFFMHENHKNLYKSASQNIMSKQEGFVSLEFLNFDRDDDSSETYCEKTYETMTSCLEKGYGLGEICVLVRKKKEGIAVANYFNEQGIPIISAETLLLKNSEEVIFIIDFMKWLLHPDDKQTKVDVLYYLSQKLHINNTHSFLHKFVDNDITGILQSLEEFNIYVDHRALLQLPLYETVESIIREFHLIEKSDGYVQYFLDVVFEFSEKKTGDIAMFLEYFEQNQDKLSVVTPNGQNAVQIMTIHKSKGLEFPIVIFPFAHLEIYRELEPKEWYPVNSDEFLGFSNALIGFNKNMQDYGSIGEEIYHKHQSELELDNINLLYVALTRAVEQLHIITKKDINSKGEVNKNSYAGLFIDYLQHEGIWQDSELLYQFGDSKKKSKSRKINHIKEQEFISQSRTSHNIKIASNSGFLWNSTQEKAIEKGNLVHRLLSKIETEFDLEFLFDDFNDIVLNDSEMKILSQEVKNIVNHPQLKPFFSETFQIINERDIISTNGEIFRPDRLVIDNNNAVIIDYKTGSPNQSHQYQINKYAEVLNEMGYQVNKKILVYINDLIEIKEF